VADALSDPTILGEPVVGVPFVRVDHRPRRGALEHLRMNLAGPAGVQHPERKLPRGAVDDAEDGDAAFLFSPEFSYISSASMTPPNVGGS